MPRTVLITGASSGIGEATAHFFSARQWNVVATGRSIERLDYWRGRANAEAVLLDVTDDASVRRAVEQAVGRFGGIDALINNAGFGLAGPLEAVEDGEFHAVFNTNVYGVLRVTRAALPHLRRAQSGVIVNVSSLLAHFGMPFYGPYCATKFALEGLTESLRYELNPFGIRVKLVAPGGVKTQFKLLWKDDSLYEPYLSRVRTKISDASISFPGPKLTAATIFRAATDPSRRLRYTPSPASLLSLARFIPDRILNRIVRVALCR